MATASGCQRAESTEGACSYVGSLSPRSGRSTSLSFSRRYSMRRGYGSDRHTLRSRRSISALQGEEGTALRLGVGHAAACRVCTGSSIRGDGGEWRGGAMNWESRSGASVPKTSGTCPGPRGLRSAKSLGPVERSAVQMLARQLGPRFRRERKHGLPIRRDPSPGRRSTLA